MCVLGETIAPRLEGGERPAGRKMTYEEFLAWCDEDTWAEWVDGDVIVFSPAPRQHQEVVDFLLSVLGLYGRPGAWAWCSALPSR